MERYRIVGAVWQCSRASIESEFLLLNSIQRYHNLKRLLLPRGFQIKPFECDFRNARSHNCLTPWDLSRTLFPDYCLHNPSTYPTEMKTLKTLPLQAFLPQQVQRKKKKKKAMVNSKKPKTIACRDEQYLNIGFLNVHWKAVKEL